MKSVEPEPYVVVFTLRDGRLNPTPRSDIVSARSADEAAAMALEGGSRWETEDGRYDVHAARIADLETFKARLSTETTVAVESAQAEAES